MFAKVEEEYLQQQQAKQREADSIEQARLQAEEEHKRKIAEDEARLKAQKAQEAAQKAAQAEAERQQLHQQAEEARLRRRAQSRPRGSTRAPPSCCPPARSRSARRAR